jgi:acyl-CoA thioesterase-1
MRGGLTARTPRTAGRLVVAALLLSGLLPALIAAPATTPHATAGEGRVRALFFGDSLMEGVGARPEEPIMARTAARELGWDVTVDAGPGTGYVNGGKHGRTYLKRLSRRGVLSTPYDVVLIEGGTNDLRADPAVMRTRTTQTVRYVRRRLPHATIVLMGAFNPDSRRYDARRALVDRVISQVATEQSVPYFSPISGRWTDGQGPRFLSPDGLHPSSYGYGVMAGKLVAALRGVRPVAPLAGRVA